MQPLRQQIDDDNFPMGFKAFSCHMRIVSTIQTDASVPVRYTHSTQAQYH